MPQRADDLSVSSSELLWRRIPNQPSWVKVEPNGKARPSSAAFLDGLTGEVSVHRARLTTIDDALDGKLDFGLVEIEAAVPRQLGHTVVADPTDDPSHALICPPENKPLSHRKRDAKIMAEQCQWLVYPKDYRVS